MKKNTTLLLVCVLLVGCVFTLASCVFSAGPITIISGEYEAEIAVVEYNLSFSPLGKITLVSDTPIIGEKTYEGKYKVNNKTQEITLTWEGDAPLLFDNGTYDFHSGDDDGVNYIEIGLAKFTAAD